MRFDNSWLSVKNEEKAPKKVNAAPSVSFDNDTKLSSFPNGLLTFQLQTPKGTVTRAMVKDGNTWKSAKENSVSDEFLAGINSKSKDASLNTLTETYKEVSYKFTFTSFQPTKVEEVKETPKSTEKKPEVQESTAGMDLLFPELKTAQGVFDKYGANAPAEIIDALPPKEAELYIDMIVGDETSDGWLGEKEDLKDIEADIERRRQDT